MDRVDPSKRSEELAGFKLKIERQTGRLKERFLDLDFGFVVVVQLENDVGETFEVRIDRAVKRELDVARVEPALLRIVVAHLDVIRSPRTRAGEREQSVERNVHVIFSAAADADGLRQRRARAVLEIVSGADETTDVSLVGKFPDTAVPFAFTPGVVGAFGCR